MLKQICVFSLVCIFLAALPAWGLDLKPGKYEITTHVEMQGMPTGMPGGMPATTITQCITRQEPVPDTSAGNQGCKVSDMKTSGNTITYTVECDHQGMKSKSTGKMTYRGDTFEGTTQTKMGPAAGGMTITTVVKGKRIGKCE